MAVPIEQLYDKLGLPVRSYPPRRPLFPDFVQILSYLSLTVGSSEPRPPPVLHLDIVEGSVDENQPPSRVEAVERGPRSLRRSHALSGRLSTTFQSNISLTQLGVDINKNCFIPSPRAPRRRRSLSPLLLLLQLDAAVRPGLTECDFRSLFSKCACGLIMTRNSFGAHYCANQNGEMDVIEITDSDDD